MVPVYGLEMGHVAKYIEPLRHYSVPGYLSTGHKPK